MKSVVTAMGNPTLNNELKRYSEYDVIGEDLFYQEAVLDLLNETKVDVLTLSAILQGQWDFIEFVDKIQKANVGLRMIVIMDEMDTEMKCKLLERGIQDIFLDEHVQIQDVVQAINREEPLTEKIKVSKLVFGESQEESYDTKRNAPQIQKQEVIAICGANGSGKSTITYQLSKILSRKTNSKILVMDLDTLSGNIDELYGVSKVPLQIEMSLDNDKKCGINYAADLIKKNRFDANVFDEIVIHTGEVDLLTGNTSLYFCQEVLKESIYEEILNYAKEKYDFILLDTSSNIFLDSTKWCMMKASKLFLLVENDYLSIKKTNQLLTILVQHWGIWKEKIHLVINKERAQGIESDVVERIFEEYPLIGKIKQNEEEDTLPYERILESIQFIPKKNMKDRIRSWQMTLKSSLEKAPKTSIMSKKEWIENAN